MTYTTEILRLLGVTRRSVVVVAAFLSAGCAKAHPRTASEIAGCYALQPGPWYSDSASVDGQWTSHAPTRFELSMERAAGPNPTPDLNGYRVKILIPALSQIVSQWVVDAKGERVELGRPMVSGLTLSMSVRYPDLVGDVRISTDAPSTGAATQVARSATATRVACTP